MIRRFFGRLLCALSFHRTDQAPLYKCIEPTYTRYLCLCDRCGRAYEYHA